MPITLVTGIPGHGKTLYTLVRVKRESEADKRPVFYHGINELKLPWVELDGKDWDQVPPNGIMVIDECQDVFPVRAMRGEVPPHVQGVTKHRHGGVDMYLITQHPHLLDTFVRKLVDRHFHVVRAFGTHNATVYEFPTGIQDQPEKNKLKNGVVRHQWRYPKKAFDWYKSAEAHTIKRRLPVKVWMFLLACLLVPVAFWFVYERLWVHHNLSERAVGASAAASAVAGGAGARVAPAVAARRADVLTEADYLARFRPRIPGLAFTAPVYDELTRPVEAPYPSVCYFGEGIPCKCVSQRGFSLIVPKTLCEQLAREPLDPYWLRRGPHGLERPGDGTGAGGEAAGDGRPAQPAGAERPLVASVQVPQ